MPINYIAGTSSNNLYALLIKDGWGLGDPEGICHWNGSRWQWVHRFSGRDAYVIDMQLVFNQLMLTTANGDILRMSFDGCKVDYAFQLLSAILWDEDDFFDVTFCSASFPSKDSAVVVGTKGSLYYYNGSGWRRSQTNTTNDLSDVAGKIPTLYVLGNNLIGMFDGSEYRHLLTSEGTFFLVGQCVGPNELIVGAQTPAGSQLLNLHLDSGRTTAVTLPSHAVSVWGNSFNDLYISTGWSGVLHKVGNELIPSLDASCVVRPLCPIGDELIAGGEIQHMPTIFILQEERWDPIPIDIDFSYLDP